MTESKEPHWLQQLKADPSFEEVENRPWANLANRKRTGCIGHDFVLHNPRVVLRFFWNNADKVLQGSVHFREDSEGPPGGAHGASIALVFDEILAYPVWRTTDGSFTVKLTTEFVKMVPLGSTLRFFAKIDKKEGRRTFVSGAIESGDRSVTYARGNGVWIESNKISAIGHRSFL